MDSVLTRQIRALESLLPQEKRESEGQEGRCGTGTSFAGCGRFQRFDDMPENFSELAVREPDRMRLVLQASVAALVNVQSVEAVDAELKRRAVAAN